jgi:GH35 family endo-1,4-beta-xylanase
MFKPSSLVLTGIALTSIAHCAMGQSMPEPKLQNTTPANSRIVMSGSPLGIAWGFLYGYSGAKAETFMPVARDLGAGFTKVYLFWNQIEPEKGRFRWNAVDAFVSQLNSPDEGLISLFSTSTWATQKPGTMLPPSPPKNLDDYYQFVHTVVTHCKGRVRYWQNDSEPNSPI